MNSNIDAMIERLTPAIEQKCDELHTARKKRFMSKIFVLLCAAVLIVPALSVLVGMPPVLLIIPPAVMSFIVIMLLPVLLTGKNPEHGGIGYEQT